eukprot:765781-Pyramimonas_sp.AAC.1
MAPWVWSHGDGRGYCADPNTTPYTRQLTEADYEQATDSEISQSSQIWDNLTPFHYLRQFNRDWRVGHAGNPDDPKSEEDDQQGADEDEDAEMAEE